MSPITLIKIALRALLRNRMRTFLSVLGIVIGVAAVITMVAMGEGSKKSIKEQMTAMGTNAIIIMPNRSKKKTSSPSAKTRRTSTAFRR